MNVIIIVTRHPDFANEFKTFVDEPNLVTVNVDYGATELRNPEEFDVWSECLIAQADQLEDLGTPAAKEASTFIHEIVGQAAEDYGS